MPILYRINCGNTYPASGWEADDAYLVQGIDIYAGANAQDNSAVPECPADVLRDHRWATTLDDPLTYEFDVSGYDEVDVSLYFAESYHDATGPGWRYFDIYINGVQVADDYDAWDEAGARDKGSKLALPGVDATSGTLTIQIYRQQRGPMVSGIIVEGELPPPPVPPPPPAPTNRPAWTVELDVNDDGIYDTGLDWMEADWRNGFDSAYQVIAPAAQARITLKNVDGSYSPEREGALAGLQRDRRVRIVADYDGPNTPHGEYARDVSDMGTVTHDGMVATMPHFNGDGDVINMLARGDLAARFNGNRGTLMMWLKADAGAWSDGEFRFAFSIETVGDPFPDILHAAKLTGTNQFSVERWVQGKSTNHTWTPGATHGTDWWHLAVTWSERGNFTRVYDSGVLIDEDEIVATWQKPLALFNIGARPGLLQWWDGAIGHVALWAEPLDSSLISVLAAELINPRERILSTKPHYLTAYWPLAETSGTQATDASTRRTMFAGRIRSIKPAPGVWASRRTQLEVSGFLDDAQHVDRLQVEMRTDTTAAECVFTAVEAAGVYPPPYDGLRAETWASIRPTQTRYAYALDDVRPADTLYSIIRRLAASEGYPARVYETRAGMLRVLDRHFLVGETASKATFDGVMRDMAYAHGETIYNRVRVSCRPRALEVSGAPYRLGALASTVRINPGETKVIRLRYDDGSGRTISTTSPITPAPGTHYHINVNEDGTGDYVDQDPEWTLVATHTAGESQWEVTNNGDVPGYLLAHSHQDGNNRLVDYGEQIVEAGAGGSTLSVVATYLNTRQAGGLAAALLKAHETPRGEAKTLTLQPYRSRELLETVLRLSADNLDRVTVSEAQTGHGADHYIVGEHHRLGESGLDYEVNWTLEPAGLFDTIGVYGTGERSLLDGENLLGY